MMRILLAIALLLLLFCFSAIQNLNAAIFEVTNTNDNGTNSFRWALEQANSNAGADIINITTIGSVLLSSNLPQITDDLTINGDGLVIDGDNSYQIFNITGCTVAINDLTIQKGSISSIPLGSSLFHTDAFVSINNCIFDNNTSNGHAGAILNAGTINIISNCTFTNNSTGTNRRGGAIFNESTGIITKISNTTFSNNAATDNGGAILNYGTINTINNCTFTGNTAFSGAGIHNFSSNISEPAYIQSIRNCTFNNNVASYGGGGIANYNNASIGNISYSTFFRNEASYHGGAIYIISETSVNSITRSNFQRNNAGSMEEPFIVPVI
jgi:hypothetical protein